MSALDDLLIEIEHNPIFNDYATLLFYANNEYNSLRLENSKLRAALEEAREIIIHDSGYSVEWRERAHRWLAAHPKGII